MSFRYEPFSRDELERMDAATVRVLEKTGMRVLEDEAVKLLVSAGASFDKKTRVVRIPERALREAIRGAPSKFRLHSRDGKHNLSFGEGNVYFSTVGTPVQVEDFDGTVRPSTLKDAEAFYRLADSLEHIDHTGWACWPRDVPESVGPLYMVYNGFKHSNKTLDGWNWGTRRTEECVDLAAIVAGGREELAKKPMLLGFSNPVSPLTLSKEATEGLISFARAGQPCVYPPECMAGGTSPATIAGLLVQQNAEVLSSIAVAQLAKRGAPSLYSSVSGVMDMRTGSVALGAPEVGLIMAGAAQLGRFYKLPVRGTGGNTEAMTSDFQAGAESSMTLLMAALTGMDFIYDAAGSLESSLTASYAKLVIDNDVCGAVKRILKGVTVNGETLAEEVIASSGPKGTYLSNTHTLKHFRKEGFVPSTFWRGTRSSWEAAGKAAEVKERARKMVEQILREHKVAAPLDPELDKKMLEFIKKVQKRG